MSDRLTQIDLWPSAMSQAVSNHDLGPNKALSAREGSCQELTLDPTKDGREDEKIENVEVLKTPRVPFPIRSSTGSHDNFGVLHTDVSVWTKFDRIYQLEMNGPVVVAERRSRPGELAMVRQISNTELDRKRRNLQQLRQPHFAACFDIFQFEGQVSLVCEYMDLSLLHLVAAPTFPTEKHIRAIVAQVGSQNPPRGRERLYTDSFSWLTPFTFSRNIIWFMAA